MSANNPLILAINPGSTSTKFGLYEGDVAKEVWTLNHSDMELAPFEDKPILDQQEFRTGLILKTLAEYGQSVDGIDAFVGRGGMLRPMTSGTYQVNSVMIEELQKAERGEHASNLGAIIANSLSTQVGVNAYIVDPISVNERSDLAKVSGLKGIERGPFCHALNSKAVAKRYVRENDAVYNELNLIVAHLGGGICISAHQNGVMTDVTDASQEGPFSPERAGTLPILGLIDLCFSGLTKPEVKSTVQRNGGIFSYLGTKDLRDVEAKVKAGDEQATTIFNAMAYQIAKEIGAMATVLNGKVDAILLTGGMAHSKKLVATVSEKIAWITKIEVYPGEEELLALSEGALRVLQGKEQAQLLK